MPKLYYSWFTRKSHRLSGTKNHWTQNCMYLNLIKSLIEFHHAEKNSIKHSLMKCIEFNLDVL